MIFVAKACSDNYSRKVVPNVPSTDMWEVPGSEMILLVFFFQCKNKTYTSETKMVVPTVNKTDIVKAIDNFHYFEDP